ncbi:MAG TPA: bacteriohopanetetrol glucosamine biosynthesis glycosyltransferase HpnI [Terriglobales bacterium]|jgi:ceramide glucosyltransferase|nr:bacteriohopanetetrol glucosamine biosynthesis glycosyltransferase HpnI [Terriglobales bacterium]
MLGHLLLLGSIVGLLSCTAFLILLAGAVFRFRRRLPPAFAGAWPLVSLLKPLHGLEPALEANLESFFRQDYPCFEIIFGCRQENDPALEVVQTVRRRYPQVPVKIVFSGEPDRPNAKVCSLERMAEVAGSDYVVISDSDVRVSPLYLQEVTRPLLQPEIGMVTCLYRGVPSGGLWSRLEALGMSVEMTAGVVVADMLEGLKFALGPTMAIRRDVLEEIGGFHVLADYCADDFVLGQRVFETGKQVVLSHYVVHHVAVHQRCVPSLQHQVRWMKSTRFSRPKGHIGTGLTFAMPFGLLGLIAGVAMGNPLLGLALFLYAALNRMMEAMLAGWGVVRDPLALRYFWLYPVRDLLGFCLWCASFFNTSIVWRGERYQLRMGGKMVRQAGAEAPAAASEAVAVDELA